MVMFSMLQQLSKRLPIKLLRDTIIHCLFLEIIQYNFSYLNNDQKKSMRPTTFSLNRERHKDHPYIVTRIPLCHKGVQSREDGTFFDILGGDPYKHGLPNELDGITTTSVVCWLSGGFTSELALAIFQPYRDLK